MKTKISMLAIDLAIGSFQVCAVRAGGEVLANRAISRTRPATLLAEQSSCLVALEACATSHHWGQVAQAHGHEVRIVPATYVKPFVNRQKNDRADAEANAEGERPIFCITGRLSMLRRMESVDHGKEDQRRGLGRTPERLRAA